MELEQSVCPICLDKMSFNFSVPCDYRKSEMKRKYDVFWCSKCDYGQLWQRLSKKEINESYNLEKYYTHNKQNQYDENNNSSINNFWDKLRIHIAWKFDFGSNFSIEEINSFLKTDNLSVCEIGCGNGINLLPFISRGFKTFAVEPDSVAREVASKSINNVFAGSAEDLPANITEQKYDVILILHVLEHCIDINTVISNAKNLLKREGILVIEVPNCKSLSFKTYKGEWPWSDIPRHLNFFTTNSLIAILKKYDFNIINHKYRGFCRQFSNSWLDIEKEIWWSFAKYDKQKKEKPNFKLRAWKLLLKSLFLSNKLKYDSVRIISKL